MEVPRARHPGTPLLKRGQPVVHIHTRLCAQSLLRLAISHFPSSEIGVSSTVRGSSNVCAALKRR